MTRVLLLLVLLTSLSCTGKTTSVAPDSVDPGCPDCETLILPTPFKTAMQEDGTPSFVQISIADWAIAGAGGSSVRWNLRVNVVPPNIETPIPAGARFVLVTPHWSPDCVTPLGALPPGGYLVAFDDPQPVVIGTKNTAYVSTPMQCILVKVEWGGHKGVWEGQYWELPKVVAWTKFKVETTRRP